VNREQLTLKRTFDATLQEVWELWTTKAGIEAWWGPDGFHVEVQAIDLRPGGLLLYTMIADTAQTIELMRRQGMPPSQELRITFREIVPLRRLAYTHLADFIPGVAAYDVETVVTLEQGGPKVKLTHALRSHARRRLERARRCVLGAGIEPAGEESEPMKQTARPRRDGRKTRAPEAKAMKPAKPGAGARPTVHVSIDVPDLEAGLRFYAAVFGFVVARPFATLAILDANNMTVCMHEKSAGTKPSPQGGDVRRYERHWTPVHVDLHVRDFDGTLGKVREAGGLIETEYREQGPMPPAFCSDPFGNGFCVIGEDANDT